MKTTLVTSATGEPIDLEEVKRWLRLEEGETAEDDLLVGLIESARDRAEQFTNRDLMPKTRYVYFDDWPDDDCIKIPFPPLRSVPTTGIRYTDSSGGSTTWASSEWNSDVVSEPGRVVQEYNYTWPSVTLHNNNPIRIEFNSGYAGSTAIPNQIKTAMKLMIGHWYENREDTILNSQGLSEIPMGAKLLMQSYRVHQF